MADKYRPTISSAWVSFFGLSHWNNQTVNAQSHLVGSFTFAALSIYFYQSIFTPQTNASASDLVVASTYCIDVAMCFAFSAALVNLTSDPYPNV